MRTVLPHIVVVVPADVTRVIARDLADTVTDGLVRGLADPSRLAVLTGARDPRVRSIALGDGRAVGLFDIEEGATRYWVLGPAGELAEVEKWARESEMRVHPSTGVPLVARHGGLQVDEDATLADRREDSGQGLSAPLLAFMGIGRQTADAVSGAADATELEAAIAAAPQRSQAETLRQLLIPGRQVSAIRDELDLVEIDPAEVATSAAVAAGLRRNASRMNHALLDGREPGDLQWMLRGAEGAEWRVFLHPRQQRHVETSYPGPVRLTGGAGTGKTVVLLHRTRALARRHPGARIVLTTFTRSLADTLRRDLGDLDPRLPLVDAPGQPGVYVGGVDQLAAFVVGTSNLAGEAVAAVLGTEGKRRLGDARASDERWREARHGRDGDIPGPQRNTQFLRQEYESIILANLVTSQEAYVRVRRHGAGVPLERKQRAAVWAVVAEYRRRGRIAGEMDFAEAAAVAAEILKHAPGMVDHTLIDEAQDLSAAHWRLLRRMTAPGPDDLFAAEDSHQRIYARTASPKREGVDFGRGGPSLQLSYRTTSQTLDLAMRVLDGADYRDLAGEPETHDYRAARSGVRPRLIPVETMRQELDLVVSVIRGWLAEGVAPHDIGVLVRTRGLVDRFAAELEDEGMPVSKSARQEGRVSVETIHRAKGSEYRCVLLAGAGQTDNPVLGRVGRVDDSTLLGERSLLYVAATRARDALVVTWTKAPNEFLPSDSWAGPEGALSGHRQPPWGEPWRLPSRADARSTAWSRREHTGASSGLSAKKFHSDRSDDVGQ